MAEGWAKLFQKQGLGKLTVSQKAVNVISVPKVFTALVGEICCEVLAQDGASTLDLAQDDAIEVTELFPILW